MLAGHCVFSFSHDKIDSGEIKIDRLLLYINEDISFKIIQNSSFPPTLEVLQIEINLGRFKFLLTGLYKPP